MRSVPLALGAGALFGAGLALSGMADPARVRGFLDLFGRWDPTLAFVMAGALIPMAAAWRIAARLERPLAADKFPAPSARPIDASLIGGAATFGVGWGLAGLCPGPALADLAVNPAPAALFVLAMMTGFAAHRLSERRRAEDRKPLGRPTP